MSYSVVIVDDEPPARAKLRRLIDELGDFCILAEADSVDAAIASIKAAVPDVLYLDIRLGTHSGFEVLDGLRGIDLPLVVFTTAYSEHAVQAYADRAFFVAVDDIQRVSAAGNYVEVHTGSHTHLIRESLSGFIAQLDPNEFLRVHRSHVVRIGFIAELRPMFHGDYELVLHDGQRLGLSRRYKQLLPEAIRRQLW